jgi:hypothetical protein
VIELLEDLLGCVEGVLGEVEVLYPRQLCDVGQRARRNGDAPDGGVRGHLEEADRVQRVGARRLAVDGDREPEGLFFSDRASFDARGDAGSDLRRLPRVAQRARLVARKRVALSCAAAERTAPTSAAETIQSSGPIVRPPATRIASNTARDDAIRTWGMPLAVLVTVSGRDRVRRG